MSAAIVKPYDQNCEDARQHSAKKHGPVEVAAAVRVSTLRHDGLDAIVNNAEGCREALLSSLSVASLQTAYDF
jgi:hypothetical protein